MRLSLSKFFPPGTEYFYSFPAGEESNFFNKVPAWKEELVAARPLVCAGKDVRVVVFTAAVSPEILTLLRDDFGLPVIDEKQIITLPSTLNAHVHGRLRNALLKKALRQLITPGKLVMAQPFLDPELANLFQISPAVSVWLNDKKNMPDYIPDAFLPTRYAVFDSGADSTFHAGRIPFPCVIKVSSSSSGDGVRICRDENEFEKARKEFKDVRGTIFVEKYIQAVHNLGVQFGIPYDKNEPVEIIGINEQLTTPDGEYLGAVIDLAERIEGMEEVYRIMREIILSAARKKGWYGVGGFDVLFDQAGAFYFIDCNFRMTAITTYLYQVKNKEIQKSVATFTGTFHGSEKEFGDTVLPLARFTNPNQRMYVIAMTKHENDLHFNAGLFFDPTVKIAEAARQLLAVGIESEVLNRFSNRK